MPTLPTSNITRCRVGSSRSLSMSSFMAHSRSCLFAGFGVVGGNRMPFATGAEIVEMRLDDEFLEAHAGFSAGVADRLALRSLHEVHLVEVVGGLQFAHESGDRLVVQGHAGNGGLCTDVAEVDQPELVGGRTAQILEDADRSDALGFQVFN